MPLRGYPACFGGESKPWIFMVYKFQGKADEIPAGHRRVVHAWDQMYWLAKTNRVCAGSITDAEKAQARLVLDDA